MHTGICNVRDQVMSIYLNGDTVPFNTMLTTGVYDAGDLLKLLKGFIENFNPNIQCEYKLDKENLNGDLVIKNNAPRSVILKIHKSLGKLF